MIDGTARDLEWFIIFVFRYQRNGFVVGALLYLFNKRALVGVEDVNLTPLEKRSVGDSILHATISPE